MRSIGAAPHVRLSRAVSGIVALAVGLGALAGRVSAAPAAPARAVAAPVPRGDSAGTIRVAETEPLRAIAIAEDSRSWSAGGLGALLHHGDAAVRARAARAVGRLQDSTTVGALLPLVADSSLAVRREAVFALGQIGNRAARPALQSLATANGNPLRGVALEALGKLGDHAATPVVAAALGAADAQVRGIAAVALWRLADSTAVDALIARLGDEDPQVRWRVLWALEKTIVPTKIVLRSALQLSDADVLVRAHAARTIGRQKSARGTAYLLDAMADPDESVVVNAVRGLQAIADSVSAACALNLLKALEHPHPYVRVTAATALGDRFAWTRADSTTRGRLAESLRKHLRDPDAATRGAAAKALIARRGVSEWDAVRPLLDDSVIYVRVAVLESFHNLPAGGDPAAVLAERFARSTSAFERATAAEVMGDRHDPGASARLVAGLADPSWLIAASCASALGVLADSTSIAALVRAYGAHAHDGEADARVSIVDALKLLGAGRAADSLEKAVPSRTIAAATPHDDEFFRVPTERGAIIHTSRGDIEWEFYGTEAPQTVRNFVRLASRGYFDGDLVHRVVPDFVVQDGDPTGTGSGGPGYTIRCEYNMLHYDAGEVGMALSGKDTGGSQWFITHSPQLHLDGRYTLFAHVVRGMDVVHRIVQGDAIVRVEILH